MATVSNNETGNTSEIHFLHESFWTFFVLLFLEDVIHREIPKMIILGTWLCQYYTKTIFYREWLIRIQVA